MEKKHLSPKRGRTAVRLQFVKHFLFCVLFPIASYAGSFDLNRDDFRLIDSDGKAWSLSTLSMSKKKVLLVAWSPGCDRASKLLSSVAAEAQEETQVLLLNASRPQSRTESNRVRTPAFNAFPVLMDHSQMISRGFGLLRDGDYLELDATQWKEIRRGSLEKPSFWSSWFSPAISCSLPSSNEGTTFSPELASALKRTCLGCHQAGQGDSLFSSLEKLRNWSAMNRQVLRRYAMPPGGLDYEGPSTWPYFSHSDLSLIQNWAERGSPASEKDSQLFNDAVKGSLAPMVSSRPEVVWEMKQPDLIPASGGVKYAHRQFGPVEKDLYIRAAALNLNLGVTHHLAVYISREPYSEANKPLRFAQKDVGSMGGAGAFSGDYLKSMASWEKVLEWGLQKVSRIAYPGTVYFIPKGSYVILEHHYQPNGRPEKNLTRLSLFLDQKPAGKLISKKVVLPRAKFFEIPPHAKNFSLVTSMKLKTDASVFSFMSHGHYRHSGYRVKAHFADGRVRILGNVPFRQLDSSFEFKLNQPVFLPAGTTVEFELLYDNSAENPLNPDPSATVRNGPSLTHSEMDIGQLTIAEGRMPGAIDL